MKKFVLPFVVAATPFMAFAQSSEVGAFGTIQRLIDTIVPIIFSLAVLFFLWNLAQFLLNAGEKKDEAKSGMLWGIIILVVMFSVLGIVNLVQNSFGNDIQNNNIEVPNIDFR